MLRDVGNCSSTTVLLALERLAKTVEVPSGGILVAMAVGPGLTLYATLLRQRRGDLLRAVLTVVEPVDPGGSPLQCGGP